MFGSSVKLSARQAQRSLRILPTFRLLSSQSRQSLVSTSRSHQALRLSHGSSKRSFGSSAAARGKVEAFKLADIGEGITECEIVKWLAKPGDMITEFDPVAEVMSDKASVEITSPFTGRIKSVAGDVGDMLKVGATLCEVELEGEEVSTESSATPLSNSTATTSEQTSSKTQQSTNVKQFKLADIGEGITECEVVKWLVQPGDTIVEFDPVCEVTSDKATVEITSPFSGTVKSLAGDVGDMLKVGATLCEIEVESEEADSPPAPSTTSISEPASAGQTQSTRISEPPHPFRPDPSHGAVSVLATPATRRFARELNVDLTKVQPTGRDGRVTKGDVLEHSKQKDTGSSTPFVPFERPPTPSSKPRHPAAPRDPPPPSTSPSPSPSTSQTIPLTSTRRAMFRAMSASLQIPHFAYSDTIDVTLLERLRLSINSNVPSRYRKTVTPKDEAVLERAQQWGESAIARRVDENARFDRITLLPLLVKALSTAMHEHPLFSCSLSTGPDAKEPSLVRRSSHDISVAVSSPSPAGGLYTPVLRSIDTQSVLSVASNLTHLQSYVSSSTNSPPKFPSEFQGSGTITLSNIGAIGGKTTHPVIPPTGQLAIGAMGRVRVEPRFAKGTEEERAKRVAKGEIVEESDRVWKIEPRMVMDVTFTADHRVVEGVELARLVETWKSIIEEPSRMMM